MKKVLSMVLAVAMMTSMAMATTYTLGKNAISISTGASGIDKDDIALAPGDKLRIYPDQFEENQNDALTKSEFDSDYFSITTKKITKGANLIASVSINDNEGCVEIKFNQDYDLSRKEKDAKKNVEIEKLEVKTKKTVNEDETNEIKKNKTFLVCQNLSIAVGHVKVDPYGLQEDMELSSNDLGKVLCFDKDAGGEDVSYGTMSVELGDIAYLEGRVYDGDEVFYDYDEDADTDILKAYPDAEMSFVNIYTNGFPTAMDLEVYADEDEYVYAIKDGKLVASGLKWDEDAYAYTGKIRSSASYVISDIELDTTAVDTDGDGETDDNTTENPETGANDVVGVATALAVVSLVAAGAVSLKK
ncbi:hypothetical protein [Angelakisella massiliensis]|uniref:hypothetical protein n=1 Tax=Angelakisella massiliensis TaxID=1871018 RepID=UPI0023A8E616|nr:hypothetical protein [Angelakisella massiliensis]